MKRWYAIHCKPREDARAEANLQFQSYEVFRPLARLRRRHQGRQTTVTESLFPRYLFVQLDDSAENWAPIRSTRGVAGMVKFGNRPAEVPETIIRALEAQLDPDTRCVDLTRQSEWRKDQRVRITEGPFAGHEALFYARRGEDRVVVLLNILQQDQRLTLPETAISGA